MIVLPAPKLVVRYPTDADAIAALLPPGLEPCGEPVVQLGVYCAPVHGEPEFGISTKVPARFDGVDGWYALGIGIDQESAIFVSRETNGQPKFPCAVRYFRIGDQVEATATHQGHLVHALRHLRQLFADLTAGDIGVDHTILAAHFFSRFQHTFQHTTV